MKKTSIFFITCIFSFSVFAQNSKSVKIEKFLKGNIQDKTVAVREASGNEAVWLCENSISFVLESKELLGNDRELDGLAVAAVLSYPQDYVRTVSDSSKELLLGKFISVFKSFNSSPNVQVTVISKLNSLSDELNLLPFVKELNSVISNNNQVLDISVKKSILNFLSLYGNNESFVVCFNLLNSRKSPDLENELSNSLVSLIPVSMTEASAVISMSDVDCINRFFRLICDNVSKIPDNYFCRLAENVLSNTILMVRNSLCSLRDVSAIQIKCVQVLGEYRWTRASVVVLDFFAQSRVLYSENQLSENDFIKVIKALGETAPLDAVPVLIEYLEVLNSRVERFESVSDSVALEVIKTLGTIGDKSAFDSLLGFTH